MLGPILSTLALVQVKNRAQRAARNAMLTTAAGLLGAIAVGFLVAAGFAALLPLLGPAWTSLVAAAVFALAALVVVAMRKVSRPPDRTPLGGAAMLGALGGTTAAAATGDGVRPRGRRRGIFASNKLLVILPAVAFAAAVIAGRRNQDRRWDDGRWD